LGSDLACIFSERALVANALLPPFQAEYEGSIPFTRSKTYPIAASERIFIRRLRGSLDLNLGYFAEN
jgi:hypothetical protein